MYDPSSGYATSVLVTGVTGAVGRAVARELIVSGFRVYGLIRGTDARDRVTYGVVPVIGDIRDPERWDVAIERTQIVVNCAFPSDLGGPRLTHQDAEREAKELAAILDRLCDAVRRRKRRLVQTFSAMVFEPDASGWVRETSAISSGRGYGLRQRAIYPVLERHRKKGLKAMAVAPGFVYGRGGWFEHGLLEPMSRGRAVLIGDGQQTMHYVAAKDVAKGFRLAIEHGLDGEDYLLADDKPTTLGAFTSLVARELGVPEPTPIPEEDLIPELGAWNVEALTYCPKIDSTKAREHLGWAPDSPTIDEGIPPVVREWKRAQLEAATP